MSLATCLVFCSIKATISRESFSGKFYLFLSEASRPKAFYIPAWGTRPKVSVIGKVRQAESLRQPCV